MHIGVFSTTGIERLSMKEVSGTIFNVQGYSIHDGPGIRTIVFMKGCPLKCKWCDNPESQNPYIEVEFFHDKCTKCGKCITACEKTSINKDLSCRPEEKIDRSSCDDCGKCTETCATQALKLIGEVCTISQLMKRLLNDAPYWRKSGGGITISGGESLAQPAFTQEFLQECYDRNIHTVLETSGYASRKTYCQIAELADLILFDVKHMKDSAHKKLTGVPLREILDNLKQTVNLGKPVIVRVPLVPKYNLTIPNLVATAEFVSDLGIGEIHLLPFHQLGKDKYKRLGRTYELEHFQTLGYEDPSVRNAVNTMQRYGLKVQVGG